MEHNGEVVLLEAASAYKALFEDTKNRLWEGTSGLLSFRNNSQPFNTNLDSVNRIFKRISSLAEDFDSTIWIGTTNGLYTFKENNYKQFYSPKKGVRYSVSDLAVTQDSTIWAATANEGLLRIREDKIYHHYTTKNGLNGNNCLSLFAFENQVLVGTDNGLNSIDINTGELVQIHLRDGLPSGEINCVTTDGNQIWMGTPKGLVTMNTRDIPMEHRLPPIRISSLSVLGEEKDINTALTFEHWQNTIDLDFIGIDIKSNQKENYEYRLLGLDDQWLSTSARKARFHNLPSGSYEFQVATVNDIGQKSTIPDSLNFSIKIPWWKSWWFYIGSRLLLILGLGSFIFWRIHERRKREKVENELKARIQQLKSEALKAQMNPHFIYNSLNAIQDFFIVNDEESALLYLSKFAQMIRQIFDYSSRDVISLQEEVDFLALYLDLEKLRFGDRVEITFDVDEDLKEGIQEFEIPPLLLQPIVENVFKHGLMHKLNGGKLSINFILLYDVVQCTIEDNGDRKEGGQGKEEMAT